MPITPYQLKQLAFVFAIVLMSCAPKQDPAKTYVRATSITDGDTFKAEFPSGKQEKIRLWGIDAPEKKQPFGRQSLAFLSDMILNKQVFLELKGKDRYKRTLAIVYLKDSTCINALLIESGWAIHYRQFDPANSKWDALETKARLLKKGLWASTSNVSPKNWRDSVRNSQHH